MSGARADAWAPPGVPAPGRSALAGVLLAYRAALGLRQSDLGTILGFTQPYLSRLERGERTIGDAATLRRIASTLRVPASVLGVTSPGLDLAATVEVADAALRLAVLARQAGRPAEAARELWPVVAALETAAADNSHPEFLRVLARARATFGVTLGHVLPPDRLHVAVTWTARALAVAEPLGDAPLTNAVRRLHGNELRKTGQLVAALDHLGQATEGATEPGARGAGLLLLARAAAEAGRADLHDEAFDEAARIVASGPRGPMLHPVALGEVRLRGALRLRRLDQIARLLADPVPDGGPPPSPQWHVLHGITFGEACFEVGEATAGLAAVRAAVPAAATGQLPQQLARAVRVLDAQSADPAIRQARDAAEVGLRRLASRSPLVDELRRPEAEEG